ncbi:SufS family cysteine desulfurase [Kiritimatiellota bacterium B12222]|nr:SufS family cysteine desulfurase [Kiritimatiellota bacterium B12222]
MTAFSPEEIQKIRSEFPTLQRKVHGDRDLVYLDNAATSQKPVSVLNALDHYYRHSNANVHRGMHALAEEATADYENARLKVASFLGAPDPKGVIFTSGTTEAINLVAQSWGQGLQPGDEILISIMEHHSNIIPWQLLAQRTGAVVKAIPLTPSGELDLDAVDLLLTTKTKLLSLTHISNALGTVNPVTVLIQKAKALGITVLIDGAQSSPHLPINISELGCDFFACSAHKMCGPTGMGALIASTDMLNSMPPWQGGGEMIDQVTIEASTYADLPYKFEAGTPNIADAIAWGSAIDYLNTLGMDRIEASVEALVIDAATRLDQEPGVTLTAHPQKRGGAVSFWIDDIHPHDVAQLVDQSGVAIRAGHVCCQPLMKHLGHPAINRASYHFYNTTDETTRLLEAIRTTRKIFGIS